MPPWCLASWPIDPFLPPWCLGIMVLSCLPGASLSKGTQSSRPWRPPQDLPRTRPFAIEIVLKIRQNPTPFQNRDSIGNPVLQVSLAPPWCLPGKPNGSFLPPWCLADCPIDPFLPPWCLQAVQMVLSCLPGASQTVQMVLSCLSGASWCLPGCPNGPFLPPWCLASCQMVLSCLPGASQAVQLILSCLPHPRKRSNESFLASLVPLRLSKWSLPASLVPPCQRNSVCLGSRPWRPPQDLPRTGPFAIEIVLKVRQNPAPFQSRDSIGNPALKVSLVPPRLSKWLFPASLVPPWCLARCPIDPFLPPWCFQAVHLILSCLPGASRAVQMVLSCLSGASLVPRRLSN